MGLVCSEDHLKKKIQQRFNLIPKISGMRLSLSFHKSVAFNLREVFFFNTLVAATADLFLLQQRQGVGQQCHPEAAGGDLGRHE